MLVKRFFACLLALALLVGVLSGCAAKPSETAAEPMVLFTDSLGRHAVLQPVQIPRPAPHRSSHDRPDVRQQVDAQS